MTSDFECLLDWLKEIKVITSKDKDEYLKNHGAFVTELCNGCILAKLAIEANKRGTIKMMLLGNTFSKSHVAPLIEQQENLKLFFKTCEKYKIGNPFDDFQVHPCNYDDVKKLLEMIVKLSAAVKIGTIRLTNLPELDYKAIDPKSFYESIEDNIYVLSSQDLEEDFKDYQDIISNDLSGVFQEIVKIEDKYAEKFLKVLGNDCFTPTSEAESLLLLHIQNLRIDSLTDLHVRFQNELLQNRENSMNGTRPNIPDAFVKFKNDFLIYSDVMAQCNFLLKNSSNMNMDVIMPPESQSNPDSNNVSYPRSFDSLIKYPFVHLCNYKNLMERIMKETREEIAKKGPSKSLDELYESAQLAHQAIHEVLFFANAYMSEDSDAVRITASKISCDLPLIKNSIDKKYGKLLYEFCARCKTTKATKPETCLCLCFHCGIFIFLNQQSILGFARQDLEFVAFIGMPTEADVLVELSSNNLTINLKVFDKSPEDENGVLANSLEIHAKQESHAKDVFMRLKMCYAKELRKPDESSIHWNHQFRRLNYQPIVPGHQPLICHLCDIYLFGQLSPGFHCKTCNQNFHSDCFLTGRTDINFYAGNGINKPKFDLKSMLGTESEKKILANKDDGTFMVFRHQKRDNLETSHSQTAYRLIVKTTQSESNKNKFLRHRITAYKNGDSPEVFYWERQSRGFQSLPELVTHYREKFDLKKPFRLANDDEEQVNETPSEDENDPAGLELQICRLDRIVQLMSDKPVNSFMVVKKSSSHNPYTIYLKLPNKIVECLVKYAEEKYQLNGDSNSFVDMTLLLNHHREVFVHQVEDIEILPYYKGKTSLGRVRDHLDVSMERFAVRQKKNKEYSLVLADGTTRGIKKVGRLYKIDSFAGRTLDEVVGYFVTSHFKGSERSMSKPGVEKK